MDEPTLVYRAYIRSAPAGVWQAIVDPDQTVQYFYGTRVTCDWKPGSEMDYHDPEGNPVSSGTLISIDPPRRLEFTFQGLWDPRLVEEGPVREVWSLEAANGMTQLTVEVFEMGGFTLETFRQGVPYIVSGLKSLVETGEGLPAPS